MKVAFGTDEHTALTDLVRADLASRGHTVHVVPDGHWVEVGHAVGEEVATGRCDTGVLFCWTGTGASIAANKVPGVRAALCTDAATAAGARTWNDANHDYVPQPAELGPVSNVNVGTSVITQALMKASSRQAS